MCVCGVCVCVGGGGNKENINCAQRRMFKCVKHKNECKFSKNDLIIESYFIASLQKKLKGSDKNHSNVWSMLLS